MGRLGPCVLGLLLCACTSEESSLLVDLKTDLVPGVEFSAVRTVIEGRPAPVEVAAFMSDDFIAGRRVAEIDDIAAGTHVVVVSAIAADRTVLAERRFQVIVQGRYGLTAVITRDCRSVDCPVGDTCVGGRCAPVDCVAPDDSSCPEPECGDAPSCPVPASCAEARCIEGTCWYAPVMACGSGQYCSPEEGCIGVPDPPPDAGPGDAGGGARLVPLESFTAMAQPGGLEGEIAIDYTLPADVGDAQRLVIRRVPGDTAPSDCDAGEVAATVTDFTSVSARIVDRVADRQYRTHSYRACFAADPGGSLTGSTMIAEGARYANPGPGCSHPPCDAIGSTTRAVGLPVRGAALTSTGSSGGDIVLSDLNGDDVLDAVIASDARDAFHLGNGDGTFQPARYFSTRTDATVAATTGDFDNDGHKDVVLANTGSPSLIYLGHGDGTFDGGTAIDPVAYDAVFDIETADLNGDLFLDLIVTSFAEVDRIYLGDGTGAFTFLGLLEVEPGESCINCLQITDVNEDGIADVVLAYNTGDARLHVFIGNGDASFRPPISIPYGTLTPISVRLADLDGDGNLDVLVGRSTTGGVWTGLGDGTGSFTGLTALSTRTVSRAFGLGVTDFDGDGDADIVFSQDSDGVIGYLRGNGDGTFGDQIDLDGGAVYSTAAIDVGDLNRDGRMDFVVGVATTGSLVFLGQ
jgi:hypothetical protein